LAKENEELYLPQREEPLLLARGSQGLFLVQRIRDEAHRFAITYHRNLRAKQMQTSLLDGVPGIGPRRRKALLTQFGSVEGIRRASMAELLAVPGMNKAAAEALKQNL
jgi:excinuclease ABC subunit C